MPTKKTKAGTRQASEPASRARVRADGPERAAEWAKPGTLIPWPANPRRNDAAVPAVKASIVEFGFGAPVVAQRSRRMIIAGHTRWKAALELGLKRIPVRFLDLNDETAERLAMADNRLGEIAAWDPTGVGRWMQTQPAGVDFALLGFTSDEVAHFIKAAQPATAPGSFPVFDENLETEHECPKCGYQF